MTPYSLARFAISEHPVARAEWLHQQRSGRPQRWRLFNVLLALAIGTLILSTVGLANADRLITYTDIRPHDIELGLQMINGSAGAALISLLAIQPIMISAQAALRASGTIAREKQGRTWDSLILTGIDARVLVTAKWWAVLRVLGERLELMFALRALAVLVIGTMLIYESGTVGLSMPGIALAIIAAVVLPVIAVMQAAAAGIFASLLAGQEATAGRIAVAFQGVMVLTLLFAGFALTVFLTLADTGGSWPYVLPMTFAVPLDGGLVFIFSALSATSGAYLGVYIGSLLLSVIVFGGMTWLLLRASQALAVRQMALPPVESASRGARHKLP
jgi:hypothetical protein